MRAWAQRLRDGEEKPDPVEDDADDVWHSLRVFADQYLELFDDRDRWQSIADQLAAAIEQPAWVGVEAALARYRWWRPGDMTADQWAELTDHIDPGDDDR